MIEVPGALTCNERGEAVNISVLPVNQLQLQGSERRKHLRFQVPGTVMRYRKSGFLSLFINLSKPCLAVNLSQGGLAFECDKKFSKNEKIITQLFFPKEGLLKLRAQIRWQEWSSGSRSHFTGAEFDSFGKRRGWNSKASLEVLRRLERTYGGSE